MQLRRYSLCVRDGVGACNDNALQHRVIYSTGPTHKVRTRKQTSRIEVLHGRIGIT